MGLLSLIDVEVERLGKLVKLKHLFGYLKEQRTSLNSSFSDLLSQNIHLNDIFRNSIKMLTLDAAKPFLYFLLLLY